ncbi:unnamed protein product [Oncorhynchus mykiss]|uniref:Uncharacterized protein n=1 Tax=Oncorhynchus mykiss TaxID=8022 RepID=A0A060W7I1_ONCMY|nr:unnamed protein product [Oncorhynchus mykiss]
MDVTCVATDVCEGRSGRRGRLNRVSVQVAGSGGAYLSIVTSLICSLSLLGWDYGNIPLVLLDVWKTRGLTGLFSGTIPRVTSISLGGFIFLGAYEKVRRTLL